MKEIEILKQDKIEIQDQKEQKKEIKFIGSIKPHKGHTLYEIDPQTMDIVEAKFHKTDVKYDTLSVKKRVIVNEGKFYISALNKKNAIKKFISK